MTPLAQFCCLLVFLAATAIAQEEAVWRWDTEWMNKDNWKSGLVPSAGQLARFPASFTKFGSDNCVSSQCNPPGSVVSIRPTAANPVAKAKGFELHNGKVQLLKGAKVVFMEKKQSPTVPSKTTWEDHGEYARDFNCANNWIYPKRGNANPNFAIPCSGDSVTFLQNRTYQVTVPANMFAKRVSWPHGRPLTESSFEFSGHHINTNSSLCVQPFGTDVGPQYCAAYCVNSCPSLNPDRLAAARSLIDQYSIELPYIAQAINQSNVALAEQLAVVSISGGVIFLLPSESTPAIIKAVLNRAHTQLPTLTPFDDVDFACVMPSTGVALGCNVNANTTFAKKGEFTAKQFDPYSFKTGILNVLFNDLVLGWAAEEIAAANEAAIKSALAGKWFTVSVEIPTTFVTTMDSELSSSATREFIAAMFGVPPANLLSMSIIAGSQPDTSTWVIAVNPVARVTYASIVNTLTSSSSPLEFPLSTGASVVLTPVSATTPTAILVIIANAELAAKLPLSDAEQAEYEAQIIALIEDRTSMGKDILSVSIQPPFVNTTNTRRAVDADAVYMYFIIAQGSSLTIESLSNSLVGWQIGQTVSLVLSGSTMSLQQLENTKLLTQLAEATLTRMSMQAANNQTALTLLENGAPLSAMAVASYAWSDLGVADDNSPLAVITNQQCQTLMSFTSPEAFKTNLADQLALVLPITAKSVQFVGNVTCAPMLPLQTRPDQRAVFSVTFTLSALYTLFASQAAYVRFPDTIDSSMLGTELSAPLSLKSVRSALQNSLRRSFLTNYQDATVAASNAQKSLLPSSAAAASGSTAEFPIVVIAAAAGGAIVLVIVVVIIVQRRKRAPTTPTPRPAKKENSRTVVAFENPMYASPTQDAMLYDNTDAQNASHGLYDEPAFVAKSEKENPLYEATEDEAFLAATSVLQQHAAAEENGYSTQENANLYGYDEREQAAPMEDSGYLDVNGQD